MLAQVRRSEAPPHVLVRRTSSVLTFATLVMSNNDRNDYEYNKISRWESRRQSKVTWRGGGIMTHDYKNPI